MNQKKLSLTISILVLCGLSMVSSRPAFSDFFFSHAQEFVPYNSYTLALTWAPGVCSLRSCNRNLRTAKNTFNLHGLWPDWVGPKVSPIDCDKYSRLKLSKLSSRTRWEIEKYWNSLYSPLESFAGHEWKKHGTCWEPRQVDLPKVAAGMRTFSKLMASEFPKMSEVKQQEAYIQSAVKLSLLHNPYEILKSKGITPDFNNGYNKYKFADAIKKKLGVKKIQIICQDDKDGYSILKEVRICLDINYNPIDCDYQSLKCAKYLYYMPKKN